MCFFPVSQLLSYMFQCVFSNVSTVFSLCFSMNLGVVLGLLGTVLGFLGASWGHLGASWYLLVRLGRILGRLGTNLKASWGPLGVISGLTWAMLGPSQLIPLMEMRRKGLFYFL